MSRRIDNKPKTDSSSNTNSDGNLSQELDKNPGCFIMFIVGLFLFTILVIVYTKAVYEEDKKSSNYKTSTVVKETNNSGSTQTFTPTNNFYRETTPTKPDKPFIDPSSKLSWSDKAPREMNWHDALNYCKNLSEYGYSDWRLPDIDELRTLIKNSRDTQTGGECKISKKAKKLSSNALDFLYCRGNTYGNESKSKLSDRDEFWSSSTLSNHKDKAWLVDFYYGRVDYYGKAGDKYIRCVRNTK